MPHPRQRLQNKVAVQQCARPLQSALGVDAQDTIPLEMSPVAKQWRDDPPAEPIFDSQPPVPFAKKFRKIPETLILGDSTSSQPGASLNPDLVERAGGVSEEEEELETKEAKPELNEVISVDSQENGRGVLDTDKAGDASIAEKKDEETGAENLFHHEEIVTRGEQYDERDKLQAEKRKKSGERDPEDSEPSEKKAKAAMAREKQKTKALEKKAKAKAKALAKKEKDKRKKEEKKAKAQVKAAEKKAKKAEKVKKTKEAKAAMTSKAAKSKTKKRSNPAADGEDEEPIDEGLPAPDADATAAEHGAAAPGAVEAASIEANHGDGDDGGNGGKKTFARRFRPTRAGPASRFDAIKDIWTRHLDGRVGNPSAMEAGWYQTLKYIFQLTILPC